MSQPRPFIVLFDPSRPATRRWGVKQGARWRYAKAVAIWVPTLTSEDGQPALVGEGVVRRVGGQLVVSP